jgi:hypothetical protein
MPRTVAFALYGRARFAEDADAILHRVEQQASPRDHKCRWHRIGAPPSQRESARSRDLIELIRSVLVAPIGIGTRRRTAPKVRDCSCTRRR